MRVLEGRNLVVQFRRPRQRVVFEKKPMRTLWVGNLPYEMTDRDIKALFGQFANCVDVRIAVDRRSGQLRGFCHVDFYSLDSAIAAKEELEKMDVNGRTLRVDYADNVSRFLDAFDAKRRAANDSAPIH